MSIEIRRAAEPVFSPVWHIDPATGYAVNVPFTAWFTDDPRLGDAAVGVEIDLDTDSRRLKVVAVTFSDTANEVTSTSLRAIPVPALRDEAIAAAAYQVDLERGLSPDGSVSLIPVADTDELLGAVVHSMTRPPRKKREDPSPAQLRQVAEVYRGALGVGNAKVRQAVMEKVELTKATAAAWIALARERTDPLTGRPYLGPAVGPKAGEIEEAGR